MTESTFRPDGFDPTIVITGPEDDRLDVTHWLPGTSDEAWMVAVKDHVDGAIALAEITRAQAHELHRFLGETLGLVHPAPRSPLTASHAFTGGTKEARNRA